MSHLRRRVCLIFGLEKNLFEMTKNDFYNHLRYECK